MIKKHYAKFLLMVISRCTGGTREMDKEAPLSPLRNSSDGYFLYILFFFFFFRVFQYGESESAKIEINQDSAIYEREGDTNKEELFWLRCLSGRVPAVVE